MAAKEKPAVITDPMAFIRGATQTPERVVIGDRAEEFEPPASPTETQAGTSTKKITGKNRVKPHAQADESTSEQTKGFPWDNANPKVKSYFQLRMPEPLGLKLKFIKQNTLGVNSVHDLVMQTLEAMVEERLAEILQQQEQGRTKNR